MIEAEEGNIPQRSLGKHSNWLSLGRASRMLGVSEATLRHWADSGEVRAFRTPGGHRRFAEEDLVGLIQRGAKVVDGHVDVQLTELALGRIRQRLARTRASGNGWYAGLDAASRDRLRPLGHQLLALALDYVSYSRGRSVRLEEAREVAGQHGAELAGSGFPVRRALQGFIFFRESLGDAQKKMLPQRPYSTEQRMEKVRLLEVFMDEVLLAMVAAYEETLVGRVVPEARRAWPDAGSRVVGTYAARQEV